MVVWKCAGKRSVFFYGTGLFILVFFNWLLVKGFRYLMTRDDVFFLLDLGKSLNCLKFKSKGLINNHDYNKD